MPTLNILDISTTIGCNLSCKGCNHFSNHFAPGSKLNTDSLIKDIEIILPRIDIGRVSIIGGEPLLNPRCEEIVDACRSHTNSPVYLYTNGLLLLQNEGWIRRVLEDPRVFLRVSIHDYRVNHILRQFSHSKVKVTEHHDEKDWWFHSLKKKDDKIYPHNKNNIKKSYNLCSCPNTQLYNGKLWKCPNTAFLRELLFVHEQDKDEVWQEYIVDGLPVDCTDEELTNFCENTKMAESVCNMCTTRPLRFSASVQERGKRKVIISK